MNQATEETSKNTSIWTQSLDLERTIHFLSEHLVCDEPLNKTSIRKYLSNPGYAGVSCLSQDDRESFVICPTYEDKNHHVNGIFISSSGIAAAVGLIVSRGNMVVETGFSVILPTESLKYGHLLLGYILNNETSKDKTFEMRGKINTYKNAQSDGGAEITVGTFGIQSQNSIDTAIAERLLKTYSALLDSIKEI